MYAWHPYGHIDQLPKRNKPYNDAAQWSSYSPCANLRPKVPDSGFTMSSGRSALSERQEDVPNTTAVLPVRNSWVTPGQTPNEWDQHKAKRTALPVSGYVRGPKNRQFLELTMHKQLTNQNI
jgi:hypothetical protein